MNTLRTEARRKATQIVAANDTSYARLRAIRKPTETLTGPAHTPR